MNEQSSSEFQIETAIRLAQLGQAEQARATLTEMVRQEPDNARAWLILSQVIGDRDQAIYCLQQALRIEPGNAQAASQLEQLQQMAARTSPSFQADAAVQRPSAAAARPAAAARSVPRRRSASGLALVGAILGGLALAMLLALTGIFGDLGGLLSAAPAAGSGPGVAENAAAADTVEPTETFTPTITWTPSITPTPSDTPTPLPTRTPRPSMTPRPSSTPRPEVTRPPVEPPLINIPTSTAWPPVRDLAVRVRTEYYRFGGSTIPEIQYGLYSRLINVNDVHAVAVTETALSIESTMLNTSLGCTIASFTVHLDLTYTYPQWIPSDNPDPAALDEWERFIRFVIAHEEVHGTISHNCGIELVNQMNGLQRAESCDQTQAAFDAMVAQVTNNCNKRQEAFDQQEGYVTFPLSGEDRLPTQTPAP